MTFDVTRVLGTTIALGGTPDELTLDTRDGHLTIVLGSDAALVLDLAGQDAIDRLAVVAAEAAAVNRSRSLKQVA